MVKVERKDTEKSAAAIQSLAIEKKKSAGTCNTKEVNDALQEMFLGKCYICESKNIISYQIEHLFPHKGNAELKFDWNNLFLSCAHCNNTKGEKYAPILDCTKVDVDKLIAFRKEGWFGKTEDFIFQKVNQETSLEIEVNCSDKSEG